MAALLAAWTPPLGAQLRLTQEEALRLAFPAPATIERRTVFLDDAALARVRDLAGEEGARGGAAAEQRVVILYVGRRGEQVVGTAYFDAHRVRTHGEVLMIVVDPSGRVARVEVLRFDEPPDYRAPAGWLDLLAGRGLDEGLSLRGAIPNVTGATLTAEAVVGAVRRSLAVHAVLAEREGG